MDLCTQYAQDVVSQKTPAGLYVRWACERHLRDLEDSGFWFDAEEAERIREFSRRLIQYQGEHAGKPLELLPWQAFVFGCLYGWKREDGLRRFRTAYVEIPRKNGKTCSAVVPVLYALTVEGEAAAEVYALATKEDQAKIVWAMAVAIAKASGLTRFLRPMQKEMVSRSNAGTKFRPLGSDSKTLDGLNPHLAVCDELHAWPDRGLYDVIEDGMGARAQPLMLSITTAGYDQEGICYQTREAVLSMLDPGMPEAEDDSLFGFVATLSPEDVDRVLSDTKALRDRRLWAIANPSLGIAKREDYMEQQVEDAISKPGKRNTVLNKQFNIWTQAAVAWLDRDSWDKRAASFDLESMRGERCYVGIDLAKVNDLSSAAYVFPPAGGRDRYRVIVKHWVPEEDIVKRSGRNVPYDAWAQEGWIETTPGNCTDFGWIRQDLNAAAEIVMVEEIVFDRHFAHELIQGLQDDGFECTGFGQGFVSMGAPSAELERLIQAGEIEHDGNRVLRWQIGHVIAQMDPAGNLKPDKAKSKEKIDGVVAMIMGIGRAMVVGKMGSVYDDREVRVI